MLSLGSLFIVAGRIGDIVGRRRASGVVLTCLSDHDGRRRAGRGGEHHRRAAVAGHDPASAYNTTLRAFALLALAASVAVLLIRHMLVRRGLMRPLSMAGDQAGGAAGAGRAGRRTRVAYRLPECALFRHVTYAMHNVLRAPVAQLDRAAAF